VAQENEQNSGQQGGQDQSQQGDQSSQSTNQQSDDSMQKDAPAPEKKKRKIPPFVIIGVVALLVIVAGLFFWHSTYYEDTDDAQIAGHIDQLSARVSGQVQSVDVSEDQLVQAGQVMIEIDPRDYQTSLEQSKALMVSKEAAWHAAQENVPVQSTSSSSGISSAEADVRTSDAQIDQAQKQLEAAQAATVSAAANAHKTDLDLERYTPLVQKDVISKQQYDQAVAAAEANRAALNQSQANSLAYEQAVRVSRDKLLQSKAQLQNARSGPTQVKVQESKAEQAEADYLQAKAQYEQAELNLSYTKIYAPYAGIITKKNVEPGQNVSSGQSVLTLVSLEDLWVIANFKETQLEKMSAGQKVSIKVDAYGKKYSGKITQIGGATGSLLSLFPPENATGNYVKVVQRLPVRIDFTDLADEDKGKFLRPGLSVEPTVTVK
jgi:membrane fusion protein (multidrug efflux system)